MCVCSNPCPCTPPLAQHAPPLFVLPPLGNTLDSSPCALAAAALAAAPKAAKAKGGKKGGGKKKAVKFAGGDGEGSPQQSGGRSHGGAATSQHTASGGAGGASTSGQTNSGTTTQAGGATATQGVAVAASAGLGRLAGERWKQRSLLLPVLATLGVGAAAAQEQPCYAMLPSAAYVLADLHKWVWCGVCMGACF